MSAPQTLVFLLRLLHYSITFRLVQSVLFFVDGAGKASSDQPVFQVLPVEGNQRIDIAAPGNGFVAADG